MSFTEIVKNEVAHVSTTDDACRLSELAALLCMGGSLLWGNGGHVGIEFSTANNAVARKALSTWRQTFSIRPEVLVRQGLKLRKKNYYILRVPPSEESTHVLETLTLFPTDQAFQKLELRRDDCRRSLLRGAFMGGGSVNQPIKDYHLELVTGNKDLARLLLKVMLHFHVPAKMTDRKGNYLVYIKEGNGVSEFLQQIGASQSYMEFESVRVMKNMRNNVNRVVNCETANLQKTVNAAVQQIRDITIIQQSGKYGFLTPKLQEAAELRLKNPEATLGEVAALSGITKSGLSHRYKKIATLAREIEGKNSHEHKKLE